MKQILLGIICALVGVSSFGQTAKQRIDYLKTYAAPQKVDTERWKTDGK